MIYSSQRAQAIQKKDIAFLGAGIHDNVTLESVRVDKSPSDNSFIEFKFVAPDGKSVVHTEWEPRKIGDMTDDMLQIKCDNQFARIDQILECFYPNKESRQFTGENFTQFINWVATMLNNADKSIRLRIKVVYNNNGYTTLPKYAKYRFIEPMSVVDKGESVIVKLGIDQFDKPIIADIEQSNPNPLNSTQISNDNPSDLPF